MSLLDDLRSDHVRARRMAGGLSAVEAGDVEMVVASFLDFFEDFSWEHFTTEETQLLRCSDPHVAERVRVEHQQLRTQVAALRKDTSSCAQARRVASLLREHLAFEDRVLYRDGQA